MSGAQARRPAGKGAAGRPGGGKPAGGPPGGGKPMGGKPPGAKAAPRRAAGPPPEPSNDRGGAGIAWGRWLAIGVIVLAVLVILPVIAAVVGEIWALLIGTLLGGFALGRATLRR
ncbi:hypothetical protein [Muricoccus radiodurans]|uniref:hypothetical protein n=1 Tax=Muricoccus radiodurans TaxID=2231721 RepID=UPI003CF9F58A